MPQGMPPEIDNKQKGNVLDAPHGFPAAWRHDSTPAGVRPQAADEAATGARRDRTTNKLYQMKIYTEIIGNLYDPEWAKKTEGAEVEYVGLDQWTAQKSRFVAKSDHENEYAVALRRHSQMLDGDILDYRPDERRVVAIRIRLNDVLVMDLGTLAREKPETIIHISVELGHAIGNQHWPAVVKGTKVYVPLTVDKKVMESVMHTHHIEGVFYSFQPGTEVIPYLAPHEIRRLFGGTGPDSDVHHHHEHAYAH